MVPAFTIELMAVNFNERPPDVASPAGRIELINPPGLLNILAAWMLAVVCTEFEGTTKRLPEFVRFPLKSSVEALSSTVTFWGTVMLEIRFPKDWPMFREP